MKNILAFGRGGKKGGKATVKSRKRHYETNEYWQNTMFSMLCAATMFKQEYPGLSVAHSQFGNAHSKEYYNKSMKMASKRRCINRLLATKSALCQA